MLGITGDRALFIALKDSEENSNISGDYSSVEGVFTCEPEDEVDVDTLGIKIASETPLKTKDGFGDGALLENSLSLTIEKANGEVKLDLSAGIDVKSNNDLAVYAGNTILSQTEDLILYGSYNIRFGKPLKIQGQLGEKIVLRVNDNMGSRVTSLYFYISGSKD